MNKNCKPEVDVAVLLLFFTRTEITKRTFEQIRKARPSRLYLYQDGAREGRLDDVENIALCRETIESMIDWDCEIHRKYQEKNYGCDPSEYISQKWMFETEEKGIIIEDDDVMSVSFFRFCKEILDKYENDTRITMICGMNHLGVYKDCQDDYFFSRIGGAIWGWATWKRVIEQWDTAYNFLYQPDTIRKMYSELGKKQVDSFINTCKRHLATGREHYESIHGAYCWINFGLNIIPAKNMTCNIGVGLESTHSTEYNKLPMSVRRQLYMKTYELENPIKHPTYVQADYNYWEKVQNQMRGGWFVRTFRINLLMHALFSAFPSIGTWVMRFEKDKQFVQPQ